MKRVFTNSSDVIHLFAQKSQDEARTSSGNVFFKKSYNWPHDYANEIYSYGHHYLLAKFITEDTVMIYDRGYSVTTAKHIQEARMSLRQYKCFSETDTDIGQVYWQIMENKRLLANARKPEKYIPQILRLWDTMNEYAEWDRKHRKIFKKDYNLYHDKKYKEIRKLVNDLNSQPEECKNKLHKDALIRAAANKKKQEKETAEKLVKFYEYETDSIYGSPHAYLRLSQDGERVETSGSAHVTVKEGRILYAMIKAGKDIKGHKIGYYTVISLNGTLKIGCHDILMDEIERFAQLMNW